MQYVIHLLNHFSDDVGAPNVSFNQFYLVQDVFEVVPFSCGEIVEHTDLLAPI